jgi:hypothetical protein
MKKLIVPIVEGDGEKQAVPALLRRILHEHFEIYDVEVSPGWKVNRNKMVRPGNLENAIQAITKKRTSLGAILVLLDADDDCPALSAPSILRRVTKTTEKPAAVVFSKREFEAWFLGGIPDFREALSNPEEIRGAKEALRNLMPGKTYRPTDDQTRLVSRIDLQFCCQSCPSFDKLVRDVEYLVGCLKESDC